MKPRELEVVCRLGGALLMLMLWHFSQLPWSHHSSTLGTRNYTDHTITWEQSGTDLEAGANYYLGGTSVLLLAGGWMFVTLFRNETDDWLPGLITLGTAGLGVIALGRWSVVFNAKPEAEVSRYHASSYTISDPAVFCILIVIGLALLGVTSLVMSRKPAVPAPKPE